MTEVTNLSTQTTALLTSPPSLGLSLVWKIPIGQARERLRAGKQQIVPRDTQPCPIPGDWVEDGLVMGLGCFDGSRPIVAPLQSCHLISSRRAVPGRRNQNALGSMVPSALGCWLTGEEGMARGRRKLGMRQQGVRDPEGSGSGERVCGRGGWDQRRGVGSWGGIEQ